MRILFSGANRRDEGPKPGLHYFSACISCDQRLPIDLLVRRLRFNRNHDPRFDPSPHDDVVFIRCHPNCTSVTEHLKARAGDFKLGRQQTIQAHVDRKGNLQLDLDCLEKGCCVHNSFGNINRLGPILEEVHERLAGVVIERLTWDAFIDRYDTPATLFYLDPPYYGCETDYGKDVFARPDFIRIATRLQTIKGRFVLSLNDRPEVREIFHNFRICDVPLTYTIAGGEGKPVSEVIIMDRKEPTVANLP